MNDEQTGDVLNATNELGVNVEIFNEFMETSSKQVHEDDYLNIALFNAMYWEFKCQRNVILCDVLKDWVRKQITT